MRFLINRILKLQYELELVGIKNVLLNDFASVIYGVPKLIGEIRILVKELKDYKVLADTLSYTLGMHKFRDNILNALRERSSVALNPVTMPIVYVVVARDEKLNKLIENSIVFKIDGEEAKVPRLEDYIEYLISLKNYPYVVDGFTLAIMHSERIDSSIISNETRNLICDLIKDIEDKSAVFYELGKRLEKAKEKYC